MATADCIRRTKHEDATIRRALRYLENRMRQPGEELSSTRAARDFLILTLGGRPREIFMAVFLDSRNRVISAEELFLGSLTQAPVYPRIVLQRALALNAASVILAHNHPSGVAEPSHADHLLTAELKKALALVDVLMLDHVIVAGAQAVSFSELGLLDSTPQAKPAPVNADPEKPAPRRGRTRKPATQRTPTPAG